MQKDLMTLKVDDPEGEEEDHPAPASSQLT